VKCIIPIAPAGRGDYGLNDGSWKDMELPMMVFTGSRDVRSGRPAEWRQEPFALSPAGDKYLIHIEGATHGSYGVDSDPSNAAAYVKAATVAFWNSCLKGDQSGSSYLSVPDGFKAFAANGAMLSSK
jgi:predicted dienelactone hydrolase